MQFEIPKFTGCKFNSVSPRSEQHGDNLVPAMDIGMTIDLSNTVLDWFDPDLLPAFYRSDAADAGVQDIEGVERALPDWKFPKLALPLRWKGKYSGYTLVIDYGLGEEAGSNIKLEQCKVSKFEFNPRKGGTLELKFRVQCNHEATLTAEVRGILTGLIQHTDLQIKLLAPAVAQEEDEDADDDAAMTPTEAVLKGAQAELGE